MGLRQVRVRHLGERARVEVGEGQLAAARGRREQILEVVRRAGFADMDLCAYLPPAHRLAGSRR